MIPQFDRHAQTYDQELDRALSISGEGKQFFAERRVKFLAQCLKELGESPRYALDYGCGTGGTVPLLKRLLGLDLVLGVDISVESVGVARSSWNCPAYKFMELRDHSPNGTIDLVYTNGVFHHIAEEDRATALATIYGSLRPGGIFALWENNPINPGTRYVMSQCSFDHDAIPIRAGAAKAFLSTVFEVIGVNYLFFFPRFLSMLRPIESRLTRVPLGAQYQILCRKV